MNVVIYTSNCWLMKVIKYPIKITSKSLTRHGFFAPLQYIPLQVYLNRHTHGIYIKKTAVTFCTLNLIFATTDSIMVYRSIRDKQQDKHCVHVYFCSNLIIVCLFPSYTPYIYMAFYPWFTIMKCKTWVLVASENRSSPFVTFYITKTFAVFADTLHTEI